MNITVNVDTSRLRIPEVKEEFLRKLVTELRTTGLEVETDAKMKITEDRHIDTGRLRASIHTEFQGHTNYGYTDMEGNAFNGNLRERIRNNLDVYVVTNVIYAQKIERLDSYLFWAFERSKPGLQRRLHAILNSL